MFERDALARRSWLHTLMRLVWSFKTCNGGDGASTLGCQGMRRACSSLKQLLARYFCEAEPSLASAS